MRTNKVLSVLSLIVLAFMAMPCIVMFGCAPMQQVRAPFCEGEQHTRGWVEMNIGNPNKLCLDGYEFRVVRGYADVSKTTLKLVGKEPKEVQEILQTRGIDIDVTRIIELDEEIRFYADVKPTRMSEREIEDINAFIKFEEQLVFSAKTGVIQLLSEGQHDQATYGFGGCISIAF
jgi:hypothetical protein